MVTKCRGENCKKTSEHVSPITYHMWARSDAYGIYTGLFCDNCYDNNYPYKKDRYFDASYCGERLEGDY